MLSLCGRSCYFFVLKYSFCDASIFCFSKITLILVDKNKVMLVINIFKDKK